MPVEYRTETFRVGDDGPRLQLLLRGNPDAPLLVLLHGGGANAHWWDHLAPSLAERFHVVALDFRGHGDSEWPEKIEPGAFQRDLEALCGHLGRTDLCLVGHSMGGHVALVHAARHPRTRAVCAIDISRGGSHEDRRRLRLALAVRRTYRSRQLAIDRYRFLPPAPAASEELRVAIARHSVAEVEEGRFGYRFDPRWFSLRTGPDFEPEEIHCPVLLVRGAQSSLLSLETAEDLASRMPAGRLLEIPEAGHNVHIERPAEVLRGLGGFLEAFA